MGSHLYGLDVLLSESLTDRGSLVTLKCDKSQWRLIWEFDIDISAGPFRNYHHGTLMSEVRYSYVTKNWWSIQVHQRSTTPDWMLPPSLSQR